MVSKNRNVPEVLDGVNPATDCSGGSEPTAPHKDVESQLLHLTAPEVGLPENLVVDEDVDEIPNHVTWLNVQTPKKPNAAAINTWKPLRGGWSIALERLALFFERPVNKLTGYQLNPLYHTGPIALLLLIIVGVTGLYLFFFFQYGFDASYRAVSVMESQFIARTIRAAHRFASGALVIVTLLHAFRTLFLEKFRGPRWLAWLTGVVLTGLIWVAGVTGYWLIWDERALLINDTFRRGLETLTSLTPNFMVYLVNADAAGQSWILFLVVLAVHVVLFLVALLFFYLHIRRLKRPQWLPPVHWVALIAVVLLSASLFFPVGMLPQADLGKLPESVSIDPIFLFFLPFPGARWLWVGLLVGALAFAALPWLNRGFWGGRRSHTPAAGDHQNDSVATPLTRVSVPPPVRIIKERCTGCTKCALDCPYGAIQMVERHDGRPHKYIALETPDLCVSCGICVGSCDALAVTLGDVMPETLWGLISNRLEQSGAGRSIPVDLPVVGNEANSANDVTPREVAGAAVIFTCERHALHGARAYLDGADSAINGTKTIVVPLPCVGAVPPDLLSRTLDEGASSVRVVGCPPDDCAGREGNLWAEERLLRRRVPRLRRDYIDAPIMASWLAPDEFAKVFNEAVSLSNTDYPATRQMRRELNWRNLIPAFLLLLGVLIGQILLTNISFQPYPSKPAITRLVTADIGASFGNLTAAQSADEAYHLILGLNGEETILETYAAEELLGRNSGDRRPFYHEYSPPAGTNTTTLRIKGVTSGSTHWLLNGPATATPGIIWQPDLDGINFPLCSVGFTCRPLACPQ